MNIWKLGCNWGHGMPYFDEFIRKEKIVLCWGHNFSIGDIVMIAQGHTIIALTKITGQKKSITSISNYEDECNEFGIDYNDEVHICKVDWIDLEESDWFKYELQQGICQVRNLDVQNRAISLFEKKFNNQLKNYQLFTIKEIADWQLKSNPGKKVELPSLQRGFVWKAKQIEDLWDSLFRGFPIGSFLLSTDTYENYFLMDGQQRSTSIALGYSNQWKEDVKMWSLKNIPTLWIDIDPSEMTESHKFVFRLVTQSHPWGYKRKNNAETLIVNDRNNALEIFRKNPLIRDKFYTSYPQISVFPYDADLPVPLSFLLESYDDTKPTFENWKSRIIALCGQFIPENIKTKGQKFENKSYLSKLNEANNGLENAYNAIVNLNAVKIHSSLIKKEILTENEDGNADNPTLFVRLNSSGTPLNGDELIYSIYKAHFPKTKELVERIGLSFIPAPLIISFVSRIAQSELKNGQFISTIKVRDFQNHIRTPEYRQKLVELLGSDENSKISLAFKKAIEILEDKQSAKIPDVLVKDLVKKNQELFLLLIYWLFKNPSTTIDDTLTTSILAKFTVLSWFGIETAKYVHEQWKAAEKEGFWKEKFPKVQRKSFVSCLLPPNLLIAYYQNTDVIKEAAKHSLNLILTAEKDFAVTEVSSIVKYIENYSEEMPINVEQINNIWWGFYKRMFWNRSLIVFAQRDYINEQFKDFNQIEDLQDTNVPWDWDHIYPDSWVYSKNYVDDAIRNRNNCIGNFRALSLGENRSENNKISPKDRFSKPEVRKMSFIQENDFEFWNKISDRIYDKSKVEYHTKAIVFRTLNIYSEWWKELKIDDIFEKMD